MTGSEQRDIPRGVTGCVYDRHRLVAKGDRLADLDEAIDFGCLVCIDVQERSNLHEPFHHEHVVLVDRERDVEFFFERLDAPDMVEVTVRGDDLLHLDPIRLDHLENARDIVARVDDDTFLCFLAGQHQTVHFQWPDDQ